MTIGDERNETGNRLGKGSALGIIIIGIFVGTAVGFISGFNWQKEGAAIGPETITNDNNSDGRVDAEYFYEKGILVRSRNDRNFDGAWDYWEWFELDKLLRAEADNNFDGKVDGWIDYNHGNVEESRHDLDNNQVTDVVNHFRYGIILVSMGRPNGATNNVWVEFYREGQLWKEFRDRDGDGLLERLTVYGWFGDVEREEHLAPALAPTHVRP